METFDEIKRAVAHLKATGPGAKLRLTGDFKSIKRVKNYFRRQECNVAVSEESDGSRLITYNSPSPNGRKSRQLQKRRYGKSHRAKDEETIGEKLEALNRDLRIGERIFVRGHENNIHDCFRKHYPDWRYAVSKTDDGWTVVRTG